ncbi:MAG: D-alanine--poly(phosphoribitol) ligase subunit DltC [Chloroflexi bacterium]|nr:D-alanine--poly(phosphoribitol) ligase subunit DltC [Chloroflexota bacterium]
MGATGTSTADRTLNILAGIARTEEVRRNLDLDLFKFHLLDSLGMVQLMVALSEEFGIEVSPSEIGREDWATPRKIIAYMESRAGV